MAFGKRTWKKSEKHGMSGTHEYRVWGDMLSRCYNPKVQKYEDYGGRGIRVCDEWQESFSAFYECMGPCPDGHSIERIDVNGNYKPGNCRWATQAEQLRNKRNTRLITHNGKTQCLGDWANELGMDYLTLFSRLKRGWTIEDAITKSIRRVRRYEHDGLSLTEKEWSARTGIDGPTLRYRLRMWSVKDALTVPDGRKCKQKRLTCNHE